MRLTTPTIGPTGCPGAVTETLSLFSSSERESSRIEKPDCEENILSLVELRRLEILSFPSIVLELSPLFKSSSPGVLSTPGGGGALGLMYPLPEGSARRIPHFPSGAI